jgi:hypothetical protein
MCTGNKFGHHTMIIGFYRKAKHAMSLLMLQQQLTDQGVDASPCSVVLAAAAAALTPARRRRTGSMFAL